jgi:hypothetical protein
MFREKISVDLITPKGVRRKKLVVEGKYVILKEGKGVRGDPTVKAEFDDDCLLYYKSFFGLRLHQKLVLVEGHKKCVSFRPKVGLSYFDVKGFFNAGAIKNAGSTIQHIKIPLAFYLIVGAVLILQVITLLLSSGRIRIV